MYCANKLYDIYLGLFFLTSQNLLKKNIQIIVNQSMNHFLAFQD